MERKAGRIIKMKKKHTIFSIIIISLFSGSFFLVVLFSRFIFLDNSENKNLAEIMAPSEDSQSDKSTENAEIVIKDLILKEIEKHKGLQVIINAREGKIIHSDDKIECKHIKCCLCDKNRQIADLVASDAQIDKANKNVFLIGDTVVHFEEITINSQAVNYNYSEQKLCAEKQTKYEHPNFSILAQHSKIDLKKSEIQMSGGVKSEFLNCSAED
ncbi:MAG: hypothetical protein US49_C0006G0015 [candidate division TM6 bacterium GW2011_GWF2_37_49]|nr:MAG: hypothetical protein US49_C0006G0015 [candidate division TM6 bacterium GW2011_GWF2_37_49]